MLNRANGRAPLFDTPADYRAFERVIVRTTTRVSMRLVAHYLTPTLETPMATGRPSCA